MYLIAGVAALAGLLFGYDAGIISGAILFIQKAFRLDDVEIGFVVSLVPLGALVASALCGRVNDWIGRKITLLLCAVLFMLGAAVCSQAYNIYTLYVGRLLLGLAVGLGSFSAPLYIAEVAREDKRGGLVTLNQFAITVGIALSYLVNYHFAARGAWRDMLGAGFIPALPLFLLVLFIPQSPRWLYVKGKVGKAMDVLRRIHGEKYAQDEMKEIKSKVHLEKYGLKEIIGSGFLRVLALGIIVSIFTQAVGINAIIYYAPTIFMLTGAGKATSSILSTVGIGIVNIVFTLVAIWLLDRLGRRPLLLTGLMGIIISLIIITVAFAIGVSAGILAWLTLFGCILFVACQAFSTGPACWLIPSEIFPAKMRGVGMGLSVAFNWGTNVLVAYFFPIMLQDIGNAWTFGVFLIISVTAFILFYLFVPEPKGVSLETIEDNIVAGKPLRHIGR